MIADPNSFLHSLCKYIVARAAAMTPAVTLPYSLTPSSGSPNALFRHFAVSDVATDPYSSLRFYGGDPNFTNPLPRGACQVETIGSSNDETSKRAQTIFESLLDAGNLPLRMQRINAFDAATNAAIGTYMIVAVDPKQPPGLVRRNDVGNGVWVFNFDIGWSFAPAV